MRSFKTLRHAIEVSHQTPSERERDTYTESGSPKRQSGFHSSEWAREMHYWRRRHPFHTFPFLPNSSSSRYRHAYSSYCRRAGDSSSCSRSLSSAGCWTARVSRSGEKLAKPIGSCRHPRGWPRRNHVGWMHRAPRGSEGYARSADRQSRLGGHCTGNHRQPMNLDAMKIDSRNPFGADWGHWEAGQRRKCPGRESAIGRPFSARGRPRQEIKTPRHDEHAGVSDI